MNNDILNSGSRFPIGFGAVVFGAIFSVSATLGIRWADRIGIGSVSYADRYAGMNGSGIIERFGDALSFALPGLCALFLLFVLSFSALLFPVCMGVVGIRGFMCGASITVMNGIWDIVQISAYAVTTVLVCVGAIYFLTHKKDVLGKAGAFFAVSGGCVICEILLSYILHL